MSIFVSKLRPVCFFASVSTFLSHRLDEEEESEEEHVHALDLRICKVNESISRHNASNIWNPNSNLESTSEQNPNMVSGESQPNPEENPVDSGMSLRIPGLDSGVSARNPSGSPSRPDNSDTPLPPLIAPAQSPPR